MVGRAERRELSEVRNPGADWPGAKSARSRLCFILVGSLALHAGLLWQLPRTSDLPPKPEPLERLAVEIVKAPLVSVEPAPLPLRIPLPTVATQSISDTAIADTAPPVKPVVPSVVRIQSAPSVVASKPIDLGKASSPPSLAAVSPAAAPPTASAVDPTLSLSDRKHDEPDLAALDTAAVDIAAPLVPPVVPDGALAEPALARMKPLGDDELARVKVNDRRPSQEIRRWDWLNEYLVRIERRVYATWAQAGRWPGKLNGVIRFQLDEQGRLQDAFLQLASGDPALDKSVLTALSRTMKPGLEESRQLAAMNYRHFRFHFNAAGEARRGQELVPWEQETAGEDHRSR